MIQWQAVVNKVMNLQVPQKRETSCQAERLSASQDKLCLKNPVLCRPTRNKQNTWGTYVYLWG
jgi:hypothetical protein